MLCLVVHPMPACPYLCQVSQDLVAGGKRHSHSSILQSARGAQRSIRWAVGLDSSSRHGWAEGGRLASGLLWRAWPRRTTHLQISPWSPPHPQQLQSDLLLSKHDWWCPFKYVGVAKRHQ